MTNYSISIVDAKVGREGMTSGPYTHKDDSPEKEPSELTNVEGDLGWITW